LLAIELLKQNKFHPEELHLNYESKTCAITGKLTSDYLGIKEVWKNTIPYNLLACPKEQQVDREIAEILKDGHLRWNSWIIDNENGFRTIKRAEAYLLLLNCHEIPLPWGMYCAIDMRRPGGLLTQANLSSHNSIVSFSTKKCSVPNTLLLYDTINEFYKMGVSRGDLLSLDINRFQLQKIDIVKWYDYVNRMKNINASPEYQLAVWLLPVREKKEAKKKDGV